MMMVICPPFIIVPWTFTLSQVQYSAISFIYEGWLFKDLFSCGIDELYLVNVVRLEKIVITSIITSKNAFLHGESFPF